MHAMQNMPISFPGLFGDWSFNPDPKLLDIGNGVYWYGVLITLGVLIVDARHKPTENDVTMARYFQQTGRPYLVVANKLDKLKKSQIEPSLALIRETLALDEDVQLIPFSAEKGEGRDALLERIEATL